MIVPAGTTNNRRVVEQQQAAFPKLFVCVCVCSETNIPKAPDALEAIRTRSAFRRWRASVRAQTTDDRDSIDSQSLYRTAEGRSLLSRLFMTRIRCRFYDLILHTAYLVADQPRDQGERGGNPPFNVQGDGGASLPGNQP